MTDLRRTNQIATFATTILLFVSIATPAMAQDVGALRKEISGIAERVGQLENQYLKPAVLANRYKTEARFNDAKVAYFMEEYQRAAVLFVDIVDRENQGFGSYREAIFLLADSLFKMRNYKSARRHLDQLLDLGPGAYYEESARLYLEIAFETRNFDGVDNVLRRMQGSGSMNAGLQYIAGKTLYRQKRYDAARQSLAQAATNPTFRFQAEYFRGVVFAAEGKIDEAQRVYADLTTTGKPTNEVEIDILELAYIAQGRLAYEKGDYDTAIDMYGRIDRTSERFNRALWELTWTLVAKEMYREARRNVEILLFSDPDPRFLYEAKLLKADLSVRLAEYDLAEEDFREVLSTFQPVKKEMDDFIAQQGDLQMFFQSLVQDDLQGIDRKSMPPLVSRWLETDATIRSATRLISDVRSVNQDLEETKRVLQEINARLDSTARVQSFPELAEGMALGIEAETRLVNIQAKLLKTEYASVGSRLSPEGKAQWQNVEAKIASMNQALERMPKDRSEMTRREQAVYAEFARLQRQLDMVAQQMDEQRAILTGVDVYIENQYGRPLTKEESSQVDALRAEVRNNLVALEEIESAVRFELKVTREQIGVGDEVVMAERDIRKRYAAALAEGETILAAAGGDSQVQSARTNLTPVRDRLNGYFAKMDKLVDVKVREIRKDVDTEAVLIAEHQTSLNELIYASQNGAGVLAYINFLRAQSQFNELILRGEVGLVDVMWQKKEQVSTSINQLFEDRTTQLRLLQDSFEEVR